MAYTAIIGREINELRALIRWRDEEEGYIGPDKFIPLAEQSDLIKGIDW